MSKYRLLVDSKNQIAQIWENGSLRKEYRIPTASNGIGCAEGSFCTPIGRLRVAKKIGDGLQVGAVLKSRVPTGEIWSADPQNPMHNTPEDLVLTRLLWLEGAEAVNANTINRFIYLHGTNQENLLGIPASHGCIRFSNKDIIEVYDLLEEGSDVEVI